MTAWAGYEVEGRIGLGGMAEVLRARVVGGPRAGSRVALKRLLPALARDAEHVARFEREARLAAQLRHPGIVEVLATGVEDGAPFIAMEYVDGCDLRRLLAICAGRGLRLPVAFALHLGQAVAEALAHAHAARGGDGEALGVVHCDVSPSNVFVSRLGEVKLGDFGVARAAGEEGEGSAAWGKVRYLAPEALRREPLGPWTDVFGLGAVVFELLTLRAAFPGDGADEVARAILDGPRPSARALRAEVPAAVDALLARALGPAPLRPTAAAAAAELAAAHDPAIGNPLAIAALVRGVLGVR